MTYLFKKIPILLLLQ